MKMDESGGEGGEEGRTGGEEADCFETVDSILEESGDDDIVRRELTADIYH